MRTMNTFAPAYRMPLVGRRRGISIPLMLIATVCGLLLWPNFEFGLVQLKNAKYRGSARVAIPPQCRGKERVLEILNKAMKFAVDRKCHPSVTSLLTRSKRNRSLAGKGKQNHVYGMTTCNVHDICHQLPQWKQIQHLYGDKPAVLGIETCAKYRENLMLHNNNDQNATPAVRIAGLYNSGTNVLERSFADNLHQFRTKADPTDESSSWDVPWGKHIPPSTTQDQHSKTVDIMPVVVVRDPFRWMASMVRAM